MTDFFLLLSAFLTALTGAITGVRPAQAAAQQQVVAPVRAAAAVVRAVAMRPVQGWPGLRLTAWPAERALVLAPAIPAFEQRRRE
jgi:hypothetical protein